MPASVKAILPAIGLISTTLTGFNPFPYNPGFNIENVTSLAIALPSHSWEYGAAAEALLELYSPQISVFGATPFPVPVLPRKTVPSLKYVADKVNWGTGYDALDKGNGAAGDPASMGVAAVMLGKTEPKFAEAATLTTNGLLNDVPRYSNGAISHRANVAELWADFVYMVPPFLAYYAADQGDAGLLQESVKQCGLYREILQVNTTAPKGSWRHIIGPQYTDTGLWSTGNAWAAAGMTRVLATVIKAPIAQGAPWRAGAIDQLTQYIKEILDGAMAAPVDDGLLRNYLNDVQTAHGFGEISGSALLAGVAYRMAVIRPRTFGNKYVVWADGIRKVLGGKDAKGAPHVTDTGVVKPAVNPLDWQDTRPFTTGSPEGQAFVVLMYAAWRDCVRGGTCPGPRHEGSGASGTDSVGSASVSSAGATATATTSDVPSSRRMVKRTHYGLRRTINVEHNTH